MKASEYAEVRELGEEAAAACASPAGCSWREDEPAHAVAPTLAKYVNADALSGCGAAGAGAMGGPELAG